MRYIWLCIFSATLKHSAVSVRMRGSTTAGDLDDDLSAANMEELMTK